MFICACRIGRIIYSLTAVNNCLMQQHFKDDNASLLPLNLHRALHVKHLTHLFPRANNCVLFCTFQNAGVSVMTDAYIHAENRK
jgi:hypothetical protein